MSHRLTVDYLEDLQLVRAVFEALDGPGRYPFSLDEIVTFLQAHPAVFALNAHLAGVNWYRHHLDELRTVGRAQIREAV
jgi:spore coat polysaccharide biosynthesis protein SpsF